MIKETMEFLSQYDPEVGATIEKEYHREQRNIELIASENIVSPTRPKRSPVSAPASCSALSMPTSSPTPALPPTWPRSRLCSSPATPSWA